MNTYNYRCLGSGCSQTKLQHVIKLESEKDEPEFCRECGSSMKLIGEVYNCFASFGSKSSEEKKIILKKRASDHTKAKMKDRVTEVRKRIVGGN